VWPTQVNLCKCIDLKGHGKWLAKATIYRTATMDDVCKQTQKAKKLKNDGNCETISKVLVKAEKSM
jgi:hypothetical protein